MRTADQGLTWSAVTDSDDPYATLALVYDAWQAAYGAFSDAVLDRLLPLLDTETPPVTSFVEAGCGTGTLLLGLAARRPAWRLAGADLSAAMLERARAKPGAGRIAWHHCPVNAAVPGSPFDAAGCFFNTLNHLADRHDLDGALTALAAALRPGGLLVFDVNNQLGYQSWWSGRNVYTGPDWRMETTARFDPRSGQAETVIAIDHGPRAAETVVRQRLFSDAEIAAALQAAGLRVVSSQPWSPTPDGVPGSTFWIARRSDDQLAELGGGEGHHREGAGGRTEAVRAEALLARQHVP